MDKSEVLARLAQDKPLFHYMDEAAAHRAAPAGYTSGVGEVSFGVGPNVLRWIADRLTGDMITFETGAGLTTLLFATLARHHYCCTGARRETDKIRDYLERIGVAPEKVTFILGSTDDTLPRLQWRGIALWRLIHLSNSRGRAQRHLMRWGKNVPTSPLRDIGIMFRWSCGDRNRSLRRMVS